MTVYKPNDTEEDSGLSGSSSPLAGALTGKNSGWQERLREAGMLEGNFPVIGTWSRADMTGMPGRDEQLAVNRAVTGAKKQIDPFMVRQKMARPGMSFDAGFAPAVASAYGKQAGLGDAASRSKKHEIRLKRYTDKTGMQKAALDEVNALAQLLIQQHQAGEDLRLGVQDINVSQYLAELTNRLKMAGIPLNLIQGVLANAGLGNIIGNALSGAID